MVNFLGMSEATDRVPSASMLRVRAPLQFAPLLIRRLLDLPSRPAVPEAQVCPTCVAFQKAAELSNGKRGAQRASRWEFVLVAAFASGSLISVLERTQHSLLLSAAQCTHGLLLSAAQRMCGLLLSAAQRTHSRPTLLSFLSFFLRYTCKSM